jgi:hypothetical protein
MENCYSPGVARVNFVIEQAIVRSEMKRGCGVASTNIKVRPIRD